MRGEMRSFAGVSTVEEQTDFQIFAHLFPFPADPRSVPFALQYVRLSHED